MYTVNFNDNNFEEKLINIFSEHGVAIITNVFTPEYCDERIGEILNTFEALGTGIDRNDLENTWIRENLPPQTRPGLYQALMSHIQPVWTVRSNKNVRKIFEVLYSNLRNEKVDDFITSFDGINFMPNGIKPFYTQRSKDWPHLDQTKRNNPFDCIQGQAVLSNTTACFRCTPGSFRIYNEILDEEKAIPRTNNWCKFKNPNKIQEMCEAEGLNWQIPMHSPKGSFIVWSSSTVHSAKNADKKEEYDEKDPYLGWRAVVYVCLRPRKEIKQRFLKKREKYFNTNRCTNHWSTKIFPKRPGGRFLYMQDRDENIEHYLSNPESIYEITGKPEIDESLF